MRKFIPLLTLTIFLYGCPRPSQYVRPELPVPAAWPESASGAAAAAAAAGASVPDLKWQDFFADPQLKSVIRLALENNRDLRMAALNIEKVRALYRIQSVQQYPAIAASAGADAYRLPRTASGAADNETIATITVGLGAASWELDFFGRIRSLKSAALEQYLATEQVRSAVQISLVAAVAQSYLALAADRENLRLAQSTLDTQQASYDLIRGIRDYGMGSDLELKQAQGQVEAARLDIVRHSGQIALDVNAIHMLVGMPVADDYVSGSFDQIATFQDVAPGLPSDVLLRRPDILMAEHQLKAANANINAARAAFFPRISLTAAAGIISNDLTNLFKPAAATWNFAPQAGLPIFDYGARKDNYRVTQLNRDLAVAEYEKSIQSAFREVSDALSQRAALARQQEALQALLGTLQEAHRLSEARYQGGMDGYLGVLVAQRSVYAAQQQLLGLRLARMSNLVALYKVLGGGSQP